METIFTKATTKAEVLAELPFYFNEDNSDITVVFAIDTDIKIRVKFGTGKGWETLEEDIAQALLDAETMEKAWNDYYMGV